MRLEGWNEIPDGYGARFDITHAPLWLRLWFRTPALDKFAYPVVVRRGFGHLTADPGRVPEQLGDVGPGWHIDPDGQVGASVVTPYRSIARPGALRRRRRRYARAGWRQRAGLRLPTRIHLPGGLLVERQSSLFWRIRLPLLAVLGVSGALIAGWPGVIVGLASAILVELLFSYRRLRGPGETGSSARPANPAG
jgi:hypothetical protein